MFNQRVHTHAQKKVHTQYDYIYIVNLVFSFFGLDIFSCGLPTLHARSSPIRQELGQI
jgi:hypothetical protein